ncbi:competence/damage-inducible protein CinA-like protein [Saccharomonospora marina XMU15]|uniref:Competence/damage-inducible protein CinA-like protein n=1 Tax=Saccharomonospora marina XMU15 TaxID=882083 RepID=H5XAH9_9PSEU|nr:nicotinamide-nucleotide amidohydrolase family protein [Saccharomonospora marina]EHR50409.1 competence/damage-inducible protein CinA-like protein [Saccharomonospora marina XMU15]
MTARVSPAVADLVAELIRRRWTVATAESLTAGLVCATLTEVPGASAAVRGGLIVYATELKHTLAGVDADLLAERGAVHPEVAAQLAEGARRRCGADWGLGLTGVAGPDPQDGVEPGTVHLAVAGDGVRTGRTLRVSGAREAVRAAAVAGAVDLLREQLTAS